MVDGGLSVSLPLWRVSRLTLAGAESEHGRLALACRIPSHHQHLVQTGGLQVRQMQGVLTARDTDRMPAPHRHAHVINLTNSKKWENVVINQSEICHFLFVCLTKRELIQLSL